MLMTFLSGKLIMANQVFDVNRIRTELYQEIMQAINLMVSRLLKGVREERLRRLNIYSLRHRRLRRRVILAYNILHNRLDLLQLEIFEGMISSRSIVFLFALEERSLLGESSNLVE